MTVLIIGLILFLGIHSLPMAVGPRNRLRERLGANAYRGLYSLVALAGLVLIVWGKSRAPFQPLWMPPEFARGLAHGVMPFAFVLVVAGNFRGRIRRWLGHPMLIGTLLWAGVHLVANGDLASLLLFGGFAVWALADLVSASVRGGPRSEAGPVWHDIAAVVIGLGLFAVVVHFHLALFGVPVA